MNAQRKNVLVALICGLLLILTAGSVLAQNGRLSVPPPGLAVTPAPPGCDCGPGHWWDQNRKSCVTGACDVPAMPDGDKGGGYFAWHGTLFINTPCLVKCKDLDLAVKTGQAGWKLVSGPGVSSPMTPVIVSSPVSSWGSIAGAKWVSIDANGGTGQPGDYVYEFEFCLCANAKNPRLNVTYLADNGVTIFLNTTNIAATTGNSNFGNPPKSVTYSGSAGWITGQNKIQFKVRNDSNVTGLIASLSIVAKGGGCTK